MNIQRIWRSSSGWLLSTIQTLARTATSGCRASASFGTRAHSLPITRAARVWWALWIISSNCGCWSHAHRPPKTCDISLEYCVYASLADFSLMLTADTTITYEQVRRVRYSARLYQHGVICRIWFDPLEARWRRTGKGPGNADQEWVCCTEKVALRHVLPMAVSMWVNNQKLNVATHAEGRSDRCRLSGKNK